MEPATCLAINEWTKKMWHVCTPECIRLLRGRNPVIICSIIDEPNEYYAKWNDPGTERLTFSMVTCICEL